MDASDGPLVATLPVKATGGPFAWRMLSAEVATGISGTHDLWLVARGRSAGAYLFDVNLFRFAQDVR